MLVVGACGLVYEYSLGVLGNNLIGSSHEQIFVVIGIMLFAMGIGAGSQQILQKQLLDKFILIEIVLAILGGISVPVIYAAYVYMVSYQVVLYGFAFAMGLLIGAEIPVILRVNQSYESEELCPRVGTVMCFDYLGALCWSPCLCLLAHPSFPYRSHCYYSRSSELVGCLWQPSLFLAAVAGEKSTLRDSISFFSILGTTWIYAPPMLAHLEQRTYKDPIILSTDSPYQHIVMTRRGDDLRMYLNGQLQFSSRDEYIYHELLVHTPVLAHPGEVRRYSFSAVAMAWQLENYLNTTAYNM